MLGLFSRMQSICVRLKSCGIIVILGVGRSYTKLGVHFLVMENQMES